MENLAGTLVKNLRKEPSCRTVMNTQRPNPDTCGFYSTRNDAISVFSECTWHDPR